MTSIVRLFALSLSLVLVSACTDGEAGFGSGGAGGTPVASSFEQETVDLPSTAQPAHTPGSPGVVVTNDRLIEQFGGTDFNLNNARYTRYYLSDQADSQPDAIVVLVPGFEGGASTFAVLAESLARRAKEMSMVVETWAIDRRSNQLEDTAGLDLAEREQDPAIGLDFLFGEELGLDMGETLESELNRRAFFYNTTDDLAFMAQWTPLVHSQDIDAVVEAARSTARNANVFLGGHSAGTGYTARYAATDFNLEGGPVEPGYAKIRGLIMLEGGAGSLPEEPPSDETLDRIEAAFDGDLYNAVKNGEPRCVDRVTACTSDTKETDCAAFSSSSTSCQPINSYTVLAGLLTPQVLAVSEVAALEGDLQGDTGISILQADQNGIEGNNAVARVPELFALTFLLGADPATSTALIGLFLDDDGLAADQASFVATSLGAVGPLEDGVRTWLNYGDELPAEVLPDNGPAPTDADGAGRWGQEVESTDLEGHMMPTFYRGQTNFSDWYYPSSGLSVTSGLGLDSTALSAPPPAGRGRSDIENLTQAPNVDIPVIAFGGSNGLVPVPAGMLGYADTLAPCAAPSCDETTPRVVDREQPNTAFPTYGDAAGGYEVHISEGFSHVDVVSAEDDETNNVVEPLFLFVQRNLE